jgi:hypothetical protein
LEKSVDSRKIHLACLTKRDDLTVAAKAWPHLQNTTTRSPDHGQRPPEITAQDPLNVRIGVAATDQPFGEVEDQFRRVDAVEVLLAEADLLLVRADGLADIGG